MKENTTKYSHYIFFTVIGVFYYSMGIDALTSNDGLTNILQIERYSFLERTSHFMFNFLGVVFYAVLGNLFILSATTTTNIMLSTISLFGCISVYYIIIEISENKKTALISCAVYAFSTNAWRLSIQPEYLILVPSFAFISLILYIKNKNFLSGIFFGFGILTSPFILSFLPAFLIAQNEGYKVFLKKAAVFLTGVVLTYIAVNAFTYAETVSGEWSYGYVLSYYFKELKPTRAILILMYGYIRTFHILIIPAIAGMFLLYKSNKKVVLIFAAVFILHIPWIFNEARLGAYQMPIYIFVAYFAAYALYKFYQKHRYIVLSIMLLYAATSFMLVLTERNFMHELRDTYVKMNNDKEIPDSSYVLVYQATRPISLMYAKRLKPTAVLHEMHLEKIKIMDPKHREPNIEEILKSGNGIYAIESGVLPPDDYIKTYFSEIAGKQGAKTKGFAIERLKPFLSGRKLERLDNYKMDVYKVTQ